MSPALLAPRPVIPTRSAVQRRLALYTQFTASHSISRRLSGDLNIFLKEPSLLSSKLPQQVSQRLLAELPYTMISWLQQQLAALCTQLVTLQSSFVIAHSSFGDEYCLKHP